MNKAQEFKLGQLAASNMAATESGTHYILLQSFTITPVSPTENIDPKGIQINKVYLRLYNSCTLIPTTQDNFEILDSC